MGYSVTVFLTDLIYNAKVKKDNVLKALHF